MYLIYILSLTSDFQHSRTYTDCKIDMLITNISFTFPFRIYTYTYINFNQLIHT